MTKIVKRELYCPKCKKNYVVPVMLSTNSRMIQNDPILREKATNGTLFKNFCPKCNEELVKKEDE